MSDIINVVIVEQPAETIEVIVDPDASPPILVEVSDPVGPPGPPGPPGPSGVGSATMTHIQLAASTVWTITHNFGYKPNVTCFENDDVEIEGTLVHIDNNSLTITYSVLVSGYAILS
jgi:hypothetical protein